MFRFRTFRSDQNGPAVADHRDRARHRTGFGLETVPAHGSHSRPGGSGRLTCSVLELSDRIRMVQRSPITEIARATEQDSVLRLSQRMAPIPGPAAPGD